MKVNLAAQTFSASVADAILNGIKDGKEDIFPDSNAQQVQHDWLASPKELERQFSQYT